MLRAPPRPPRQLIDASHGVDCHKIPPIVRAHVDLANDEAPSSNDSGDLNLCDPPPSWSIYPGDEPIVEWRALTVALLDPRLLPDLRVDGHGAQVIALGAALDDRAREAVDAIAFPRPEIDRHAVEPAGPAQQRHELLGDSRRRLGAAEVLRTNVRDLVAGVTETQEPCVARIEEIPFLVQRHGERRTLPEQPLVAILDRHGGYFTEFRQPQQRSFVIYENPLGPHVPNPLFIKRRTLGTPRA